MPLEKVEYIHGMQIRCISHVSVPTNMVDVDPDSLTSGEVQLLQTLEGRLTVKQFTEFQKAETDIVWRGNVADTNLFYMWQALKKECFNMMSDSRLSSHIQEEGLNISDNIMCRTGKLFFHFFSQ